MDPLIRKIILATDFSEASRDASYHAILLAQTYNAELKALHVFNPRPLGIPSHKPKKKDAHEHEDLEKTRQRGKDILNELANSFNVKADAIFTEGEAGPEIIRIATELNTDLLVVGTHGYTGWNRFSLGSVAEYVVRHAPCAVLTIKPTERSDEK